MELDDLRETISSVDKRMAELFQQRMEAVRALAAYKREQGLAIEDKEHEARKLAELSTCISDEALRPFYASFLENTMHISKEWQEYLSEDTERRN